MLFMVKLSIKPKLVQHQFSLNVSRRLIDKNILRFTLIFRVKKERKTHIEVRLSLS